MRASSPVMSIPNSTTSSVWSSNGSDSVASGERRCPFTNVPLDDLTSLIKTWHAVASPPPPPVDDDDELPPPGALGTAQISACILESTLESKKPLRSPGTVFWFVWRPILMRVPGGVSAICLGTNVSFRGVITSVGNGDGCCCCCAGGAA